MIALYCPITENSQENKDTDILVLPLDVTKFDTHQDALETVLDHFGQVKINITILCYLFTNVDMEYMIQYRLQKKEFDRGRDHFFKWGGGTY